MTLYIGSLYAYARGLPEGCKLCMRGSKLVVFVTGLCDDTCFYCPVSRSKLGRDLVYADEEPVTRLIEVVEEAERIGAEGAGITGGDPLLKLDRTVRLLRFLKDFYGPSFHVHLYTSGRYATREVLLELARAGLDELRLHPTEPWLWRVVEKAVAVIGDRVSVGVEVPVFPDRVDQLLERIKWLDSIGVEFINLNELEASPDNVEAIRARGYQVEGYRVLGSYEAGIRLVEEAYTATKRIVVHFCSAAYKDKIQFRRRMLRKARRAAKPYEQVTIHGTVVFLEADTSEALQLAHAGYGEVVGSRARLHPHSPVEGALVEAYPNSSRSWRLSITPSRTRNGAQQPHHLEP